MKKIYILIMLLALYSSSFAYGTHYTVSQNNWRWRNNDGSETKASWKAAQNNAVNYNGVSEVIRLRIEIVNNSTYTQPCQIPECMNLPHPTNINMDDSLQFSTTPTDTSSWKNIGLDSSLPFVMAKSDSYVTQDYVTTPQLTGSSYPFYPGKIMVSDSVLVNNIGADSRSEYEWAIKGTKNLLSNTTYYFRQRRVYSFIFKTTRPADSTVYLTPYPSLKTGTVLAIKLNSFKVSNDDNKIILEWSTAAEQHNNYFNIQRSEDGRTWQTINRVNGKGNSSVTTSYTAYDYSPPLTGTVYYRLQQFDNDGSFTYSDIKSVNMSAITKTIVAVIPNPARESINFRLENITAKNIQATLTNVDGRILHEQTFENVQPGSINKLNLQHLLPPGLYVLRLKGDGLSESIKVIVQ